MILISKSWPDNLELIGLVAPLLVAAGVLAHLRLRRGEPAHAGDALGRLVLGLRLQRP
jgi:hypothetical protein